MTNRVMLAQLRNMQIHEVSNLPVEQLAMLLEEMSVLKADCKSLDNILHTALVDRFSTSASDIRQAAGKDTGTIRMAIGVNTIIADLPKDVEWDQAALKTAVDTIAKQGEPIEQYVNVKYTVPESRYSAWPDSLKAIFEPARSVGVGRETYKIAKDA
jgi:hypothetical protein